MVSWSTLLEVVGFAGTVVFAALAWGGYAGFAVAFAVMMVVGYKLGDV